MWSSCALRRNEVDETRRLSRHVGWTGCRHRLLADRRRDRAGGGRACPTVRISCRSATVTSAFTNLPIPTSPAPSETIVSINALSNQPSSSFIPATSRISRSPISSIRPTVAGNASRAARRSAGRARRAAARTWSHSSRRFRRRSGTDGWFSWDAQRRALRRARQRLRFRADGKALGNDQLAWLERDLAGLPASKPVVVFAHVPLYALYPQWGWTTEDGSKALALLARFDAVTVLNGHIHQVIEHKEGNIRFASANATAYPQPAPGAAPNPGRSRCRRINCCTRLATVPWRCMQEMRRRTTLLWVKWMDELELARAFVNREAWAYEAAYREHGSVLYAAALQVLRDSHDAQDCVHDVFLRLWRRGDAIPARTRVAASLSGRLRPK